MKNKLLKDINCLKCNKNFDEALKIAQKAYSQCKDNCFLNEMAQIYALQNKRKEVIKIYIKMLKSDKDDLFVVKKLAYNYFYIGEYKKALRYYQQIFETDPQVSENCFNIASMYHFLKNYKKAFQYYTNALKLNPYNQAALNNLGLVYLETKDYKNAINVFESAIKIAPNNPEGYHHMGIINREYKKDYELSELYLKKALRIDPKHAENSYQLALTYYAEGKIPETVEMLTQCLELSPKHKACFLLLKKLKTA